MAIDQAMITKLQARDIFPIARSATSGAERIIVSEGESSLIIDDTTSLPLQELIQNPALRAHLLGEYQRLPFVVRAYATPALFSDRLCKLRSVLVDMGKGLSEDAMRQMHLLPSELRNIFFRASHDVCELATDMTFKFARYLDENPDKKSDLDTMKFWVRLEEAVMPLFASPPAVRVNVPSRPSERAESLLFITRADKGARLFMGWKANLDASTPAAEAVRKKMLGGQLPVRRFLNHIDVRQGAIVGIPSRVPFGMTGGRLEVIEVGLPGVGVSLNNGWGDRNDVILEQVFERIGSGELARLFAEGRIQSAELDPRSMQQSGGYVRHYDVTNGTPLIEIGDCAVSRIAIPSTAAAPIPAFGIPTVWVMEQGAMRVVSPQRTVVDLNEGDACFVPAAAQGLYTFVPHATGAQPSPLMSLLTVTGMPNPVQRALNAAFTAGYTGAPVPSVPRGLR